MACDGGDGDGSGGGSAAVIFPGACVALSSPPSPTPRAEGPACGTVAAAAAAASAFAPCAAAAIAAADDGDPTAGASLLVSAASPTRTRSRGRLLRQTFSPRAFTHCSPQARLVAAAATAAATVAAVHRHGAFLGAFTAVAAAAAAAPDACRNDASLWTRVTDACLCVLLAKSGRVLCPLEDLQDAFKSGSRTILYRWWGINTVNQCISSWRNVDASRCDFFLRAPTFVIVPASYRCVRVGGWPSRVAQPLALPRCRPALPVSTVADGRVPSNLGGGERDRRLPSRAQCDGSACGLPGAAGWTSAGCLWLLLPVIEGGGGGGIASAEVLRAAVAPRHGSGAESTLVVRWWPLTC